MAFLDRFSSSPKHKDELDHVVSNLTAILNTKEGYGSVVGQLGIGSYLAKQGSRDALSTLKEEIAEEIRRHEPRLKDVTLEVAGKTPDLYLCFDLLGQLAGKRCKLRVLFHTTFGNVIVEKVAP